MKRNGLYVIVIVAVTLSVWGVRPTLSVRAIPPTYYYSQGSLAPNLTSSWNTAQNGTGSPPTNFTSGGTFVIQSGHNMATSAAWSISGTGPKLQIENGGTLTANDAVTLTAATTFQIDSGGTYVHNNTSAYGSSIFQGIEAFAPASTVILNNSNTTGPSGVAFGNLIINFTTDPGGVVGSSGNLTTINGSFIISSTMTREFRLAASASSPIVSVGGNLIISGGTLNLTSGTATTVLNIGGNVDQSGGTLNRTGTGMGLINVAGNWSKTGGTFTATGIGVIFSGIAEQTITGTSIITFANLTVTNTAGVVIPTLNTPVITGTLVNSGTLKQVQTVGPSANDVKFLEITNGAGTVKYHGVEITNTTTSDMGVVTVTVKGNQPCTTDSTSAPIQRCFNIAPTTAATTTIKFWYTFSELNGNDLADLKIYHWAGAQPWTTYTTSLVTGTEGSDSFIQVDGIDSFSPFVLDDSETGPTAVTMRDLTASSTTSSAPLVLGVFGLFAGGLLLRRKVTRATAN